MKITSTKQHNSSNLYSFLFILVLLGIGQISVAQTSLKFENGGGPTGSGPSVVDQVVTFYNGDGAVFSPTTTVTYSLTNQQFDSIEGKSAPFRGLQFGSTIGANTGTGPSPFYPLMSANSSTLSSFYSTNGVAPAITTTHDYAIQMIPFTDALITVGSPVYPITVGSDVYYADLTLTFNRPVTNPVLHFTGMGGNNTYNNGGFTYSLGFSSKFEIISGQTISKIAGNPYLDVTGNNISNSATYFGSNSQGSRILNFAIVDLAYAASGSVLVTGTNITTITFKVYVTPDGGRELVQANGNPTPDGPYSPIWAPGSAGTIGAAAVTSGDHMSLSVTLASDMVVLPLTGLVLNASVNSNTAIVNWKTETETDTKNFIIEKSTDGINFTALSTEAAAGNSSSTKYYSFSDANITTSPIYYYRIKSIDIDGKFQYSNSVLIRLNDKQGIKVFPTIVHSKTQIEFNNKKGNYSIKLMNTMGQVVLKQLANITSAVEYININRNSKINAGIYYLQITNTQTHNIHTQKLILD